MLLLRIKKKHVLTKEKKNLQLPAYERRKYPLQMSVRSTIWFVINPFDPFFMPGHGKKSPNQRGRRRKFPRCVLDVVGCTHYSTNAPVLLDLPTSLSPSLIIFIIFFIIIIIIIISALLLLLSLVIFDFCYSNSLSELFVHRWPCLGTTSWVD